MALPKLSDSILRIIRNHTFSLPTFRRCPSPRSTESHYVKPQFFLYLISEMVAGSIAILWGEK